MTEEQTNQTQAVEGEIVENETPVTETGTNETTTQPSEAEARIAQLEQEVANYKDQWLRSVAEFKNFKRRADSERGELISRANANLLLKLLPVVDDLERATASVTQEVAESQWYGGFKLIPQKLRTLLESEGVTAIVAEGEAFDPTRHEAVIYDEGDGEETVVTAELQKGYSLKDKVLRPAMVKVGKK